MADMGWVSLYRELLGKPIWLLSTPGQRSVLIAILLSANHAEKKWEWHGKPFTVQPGQFVTSLPKLAEKSGKGITIQIVRGALQRFTKMGFSTDQSTDTGRLITIVNWAKYQTEEKRQQTIQQTGNRPTTPNNNVNNDNKNNRSSVDDRKTSLESNFNLLWKLYPRKEGKKKAFDAYKRAIKKGATNKQIQDGIVAYKKQLSLNDTPKEFTKQGGTWFFNLGWEDDYSTEPQGFEKRESSAERERTATDAAAEQAADLERLEEEAKRRLNE